VSLADRLRDLLGKDDEPEKPDPQEVPGDEEDDDDEDDASVYPLW
jgi:hypothetical protein